MNLDLLPAAAPGAGHGLARELEQPAALVVTQKEHSGRRVERYLPDLIQRVLDGRINPGKVFDLTLPLDQVAEGYRAMDERRAIKALLKP